MITSNGPERPGAASGDNPRWAGRDAVRAGEQAADLFALAQRHAGVDERKRRDWVRDVVDLSATFTSARSRRVSGYMNEAQQRAAYLGWFTPINALRVASLIERLLDERAIAPRHLSRVADLGAGPLSASIGVAMVASAPVEILALDRSKRALEDGASLLEALAAQKLVQPSRIDRRAVDLRREPRPLPPGRFSLIVIANVLNELGEARRGSQLREAIVQGALRALEPDGRVLLIEPAGRVPTRALMALRDVLVGTQKAHVLSPCPDVVRCPLLSRRTDWCHQEVRHPLPSHVKTMAAQAGLAAEHLQLSHLLLSARSARYPHHGGARLVGGVMGGGREQRRYACTADGLVALKARDDHLVDAVRQPLRGEKLSAIPEGVTIESPDRARAPQRKKPRQRQHADRSRKKPGAKGRGRRSPRTTRR